MLNFSCNMVKSKDTVEATGLANLVKAFVD